MYHNGKYYCDNCDEEIENGVTIELNFHVGSIHSGTNRDFCSDLCFQSWAINGTPEVKKGD